MKPAKTDLALLLSGLLVLSGCATKASDSASQSVTVAVDDTGAGLADAALAPLSDLNLRKDAIPEILARLKSPYLPAPDLNCPALTSEILSLSSVLGPDADLLPPDDDEKEDYTVMAGEKAADFTLDTIESTTTGFYPFRGLIRQATGASAHERRLRRAYSRGLQRRAYLKGLGEAMSCAPPAAPEPPPEPDPETLPEGPPLTPPVDRGNTTEGPLN